MVYHDQMDIMEQAATNILHYMAFAKTPKPIRIAVLSASFKIGLKYQVKKSQKFPISKM